MSQYVCGLVPRGHRRIAYDSPCVASSENWAIRWIAAHEVAHIYYRDWERGSTCKTEIRADLLANQLTAMQGKSHQECYPANSSGVFVPHAL